MSGGVKCYKAFSIVLDSLSRQPLQWSNSSAGLSSRKFTAIEMLIRLYSMVTFMFIQGNDHWTSLGPTVAPMAVGRISHIQEPASSATLKPPAYEQLTLEMLLRN